MNFVNVSARIPTLGRLDTLPMTLTSLAFQTRMPREVVILDEASKTVLAAPAVQQAVDLLSLRGAHVRILRNRIRMGIGMARYRLLDECKHDLCLQVDDDVFLEPTCLDELYVLLMGKNKKRIWSVPHVFLVPDMNLDGYYDRRISRHSSRVKDWVEKYPWFIPYFQYLEEVIEVVKVAGTHCILMRRKPALDLVGGLSKFGKLPREDTYMTTVMGTGLFTSKATCVHFMDDGQPGRQEWSKSVFYKLHEVVMEHPKEFVELMGG